MSTVVLFGCESWSLTLREEHRVGMRFGLFTALKIHFSLKMEAEGSSEMLVTIYKNILRHNTEGKK
jgi:hypothetical protein